MPRPATGLDSLLILPSGRGGNVGSRAETEREPARALSPSWDVPKAGAVGEGRDPM
jgi:hypothetical protein